MPRESHCQGRARSWGTLASTADSSRLICDWRFALHFHPESAAQTAIGLALRFRILLPSKPLRIPCQAPARHCCPAEASWERKRCRPAQNKQERVAGASRRGRALYWPGVVHHHRTNVRFDRWCHYNGQRWKFKRLRRRRYPPPGARSAWGCASMETLLSSARSYSGQKSAAVLNRAPDPRLGMGSRAPA
jgi:hypothetical protein